jgi:UDP-N-acetylglucosamine--N-acetylmuramyl-(pentapeptide) pyrophosphoryl-undecaprenol N-acetylglucosamine transferase
LIFITLGTHGQPFGRALDLLATLTPDEDLVVQHGITPPRPEMAGVRWVEYFDWDKMVETMRRADAVVSHAGVGSAVTALRAGKRPVLVPRLGGFGEHVDDHQLQLSTRFSERGLAFICRPGDKLAPLVELARQAGPIPGTGSGADLAQAVARAALGNRFREPRPQNLS